MPTLCRRHPDTLPLINGTHSADTPTLCRRHLADTPTLCRRHPADTQPTRRPPGGRKKNAHYIDLAAWLAVLCLVFACFLRRSGRGVSALCAPSAPFGASVKGGGCPSSCGYALGCPPPWGVRSRPPSCGCPPRFASLSLATPLRKPSAVPASG